jgi:hypothetical protein
VPNAATARAGRPAAACGELGFGPGSWAQGGGPRRIERNDRKLVASIEMPYSILIILGTQGLSCGYDGGEPAAPEE